ncbi:DUF6339 family protein [Streptomyces sp. NPDC053499]|uniref:DNA cytosine methyltransferase n=1 Tax=Streptomyces sp. NPDC053499 TaxID=3365707 RepID=UPI0037D1F3B0
MALLYPRLLADRAKALHSEYKELPVVELARRAATHDNSAVYVATGGDRISEVDLSSLRERVVALACDAGFPDVSSRSAHARFDLDLAVALHTEMGLAPAEAASGDVWAFLSLVLLPDVAHWRFPRPPRDRVLASDLTRHVFGRLWWRAQLVHDPTARRPYEALEILGEAAFDQIYARRKALGGSPHLVRGILRVWNSLSLEGVRERDVLRDFLKRLLRLAPFVVFEALGADELDAELHAVAREAVAALRAATETPGVSAAVPGKGQLTHRAVLPVPRPGPEVRTASPMVPLSCVELCAGAGGLALGLERAGFRPVLLVDSRPVACRTLRANRPGWNVRENDLLDPTPDVLDGLQGAKGVDLLSAGLPRLKAAAAVNRGRGNNDELRVLRAVVEFACLLEPRALLLENVPELIRSDAYEPVRESVEGRLAPLGYRLQWFVVNALEHGVPQDREQGVLVALRGDVPFAFRQPDPSGLSVPTVGEALLESMAERGWPDAARWAKQADRVAPTLVGGSWDRGGPDLGPTGSKRTWKRMGVNGGTIADEVPGPDFRWDPELGKDGLVRLTVGQAALLQGFQEGWRFEGGKTARYRQVGNACPPPVGEALGRAVRAALTAE